MSRREQSDAAVVFPAVFIMHCRVFAVGGGALTNHTVMQLVSSLGQERSSMMPTHSTAVQLMVSRECWLWAV